MATGDVMFLAPSLLGVFVYLVVALAGVILTMECYAQQRSRLHWLRELEYLLELAQRERRPVPPWLLVLLMVLTGLAMLTAGWAIWLQVM